MNGRYAAFDTDGRIQYIMSCPVVHEGFESDTGLSVAAAPGETTDQSHYVLDGQVVPRQQINLQADTSEIIADGTDEAIISNIPAGVTVEWPDGQSDEITDGEVRFSVDLPGTYSLKFSAIPYLDQEVVIEAVPAT